MTVSEEFLRDALHFAKLFYRDVPLVYGEELQEDLLEKYPKDWLRVVFQTIGWFGDEPPIGGVER